MTDNVVTLPVIRIERDGEDMSDLVERAAAALAQHAQKPDEWIEYYRPAARAVVAALSRPAHGGWQPIATAPKDGTDILVCDDTKSDGFRQVVFWDEDRTDEWRWSTSDGPTFHQNAFTHWQHLPAPPITRNDRGSPSNV